MRNMIPYEAMRSLLRMLKGHAPLSLAIPQWAEEQIYRDIERTQISDPDILITVNENHIQSSSPCKMKKELRSLIKEHKLPDCIIPLSKSFGENFCAAKRKNANGILYPTRETTIPLIEPEYIPWYFAGLAPFVHYIPMNTPEEWLLSHEKVLLEIKQNAAEFAQTYLTRDAKLAYLYNLIIAYHVKGAVAAPCLDFVYEPCYS